MLDITPSKALIGGLFLLMLAIHLWALWTAAYFYIWWLDMLMHFLGGVFVGMNALFWFRRRPLDGFLLFWVILGSAAIVGVTWEFLEFLLGHFFSNAWPQVFVQSELTDTLSDLFFDFAGGASAVFLFKKGETKL